jgi:hypothetical protein
VRLEEEQPVSATVPSNASAEKTAKRGEAERVTFIRGSAGLRSREGGKTRNGIV